jgi:hypothetical protein
VSTASKADEYPILQYDKTKVRSLILAIRNVFPEDDRMQEFCNRLEWCFLSNPMPSTKDKVFYDTMRQLSRHCKTGGKWEHTQKYCQQLSMEVFGRILQRW